MLLYAWDLTRYTPISNESAEESPTLFGLLATMLAQTTDVLLRRELLRSHSSKSSWMQEVRGRVNLATCAKDPRTELGYLNCTHPCLSEDNLQNRIIKRTIRTLSTSPNVFHPSKYRERELRQRLHNVQRSMVNVTDVEISSAHFSQLQLTRHERVYALPLQICKLLHQHKMPSQQTGDPLLKAVLSDESNFDDIFENFVRNYYSHHLEDSVRRQTLHWPVTSKNKYLPTMHTDITIEFGKPVHRKLIIDTKYYKQTLVTGRFGDGDKFHSAHLYQMYAYLRTQEANPLDAVAEGMLLYPVVKESLDEFIEVQGHKIRIATINLSESWRDIERNLLNLVGKLPEHL